jgi:toxin ParE1/3/4
LRFWLNQADLYFDALFDWFESIAENPFAFESVDYIKPGYRRCPSGSDTIYYRIRDNVAEIMAIVGRQDLNNVFDSM